MAVEPITFAQYRKTGAGAGDRSDTQTSCPATQEQSSFLMQQTEDLTALQTMTKLFLLAGKIVNGNGFGIQSPKTDDGPWTAKPKVVEVRHPENQTRQILRNWKRDVMRKSPLTKSLRRRGKWSTIELHS